MECRAATSPSTISNRASHDLTVDALTTRADCWKTSCGASAERRFEKRCMLLDGVISLSY